MKNLNGNVRAACAAWLLAVAVLFGAGGAPAVAEEAASPTIDLLVIPDSSAYEIWDTWEIVEFLDFQIETANAALTKAGTDVTVRMVKYQSDWSLDARAMSASKVLSLARENETYAAMRDKVAADVVVVVIGDGEYGNHRRTHADCGAAGFARPGSAAAKDKAFVVIGIDNACPSNFGLTHQLGHLFGVRHSRYDVLKAGGKALATNPNISAFGYVDVKNKVADVMALDTQCEAAKIKCKHQPFYSDPELLVDGKIPLGRPAASGRWADGARAVRKAAPIVAGYR
jgi:hypothetical protein